jgi:hypothetical protein
LPGEEEPVELPHGHGLAATGLDVYLLGKRKVTE